MIFKIRALFMLPLFPLAVMLDLLFSPRPVTLSDSVRDLWRVLKEDWTGKPQ